MKVVIIGNGILGLMTAYRLVQLDRGIRVVVIGPADHRGCATLAALAMLNSYGELIVGLLESQAERRKFELNRSANPYWPPLLKELEHNSGLNLEYGFGTYVINNPATEPREDENFEAIISGLNEFKEPYESIPPTSIPHYRPSERALADRAVFIAREGWVNPFPLVAALKKILADSERVTFVLDTVDHVEQVAGKISRAITSKNEVIEADIFLLAPGATFTSIVRNSRLELEMPRIFYGIGCTVLLKTDELTLSHCIRTPHRGQMRGVYSAPQGSAHTIIGATNFISPTPEELPRVESVHSLLGAAMDQINVDFHQSQHVRTNLGWRPISEDALPLLGGTSIPNLYVATGTKRDGLHCSPVISEYIAALMLKRPSTHDLSAFAPERKLAPAK